MEISSLPVLAILGGTGKEGKGLAYRWAKAGYRVLIGSRQAEKAQAAALELSALLSGKAELIGISNLEAAEEADILVLTVPYSAHASTLEGIQTAAQGKLLIDVTVPLNQAKVTKVSLPPAGSAAQEARHILGEGVEVVDAFQNISHEHLLGESVVDCDVLVCGTSKAARLEALKLVEAAGFTGWDAGPIENCAVVEGMTSLLIYINRQYDGGAAGIRITGAAQAKSGSGG